MLQTSLVIVRQRQIGDGARQVARSKGSLHAAGQGRELPPPPMKRVPVTQRVVAQFDFGCPVIERSARKSLGDVASSAISQLVCS